MSAATDGWVHVTHPDTGGEALISAEPDVVALYEAKGWLVSDGVPAHLDPDHPGEPDWQHEAEVAAADPPPADEPDLGPASNDDPAPADNNEGVIERG